MNLKSMYLSKNFKYLSVKNIFKIVWFDVINFYLFCKKMVLLSICIMIGNVIIFLII